MHLKVKKVIQHMQANLHQKLVLEDLAQLAGLSRSRLCDAFKTETGMSAGRYLKTLRIQKAHELLETTSLSAKEIGAAVGLRDHSHFSRDFKKTYDLTPTGYRKRLSGAAGEE